MGTPRYVLCRRDLADLGAAPDYCCKPITAPNVFDWCADCYSKRLRWPSEAREPEPCPMDSRSMFPVPCTCREHARPHRDPQGALFAREAA